MIKYKLRILKSQINILPKGDNKMTKLRSFDKGQSVTSTINAANATVGAVAGGIGAVKGAASALGSLSSADSLGTMLRTGGGALNSLAEGAGDIMSAVSMFGGDTADPNDWRVRLSIPNWVSFKNSPVLRPLKDAGGLVFPYTPRINIKSSAAYNKETMVHQNYTFASYKNSEPGQIEITAPMNVEDSDQALFWIAAVHYLRSASKMFAGNDPKAGNPPPIVFLNGYGNFVFKNVPVVITNFSTILSNDCDYISTEVIGSSASEVADIADSVGGLADTVGGVFGDAFGGAVGKVTGAVSSIAGAVSQVSGLLGTFGVGGTTSGGYAYVPTKSEFSITLQPIYSRDSARKFSLDRFVQGGYLNGTFGYI